MYKSKVLFIAMAMVFGFHAFGQDSPEEKISGIFSDLSFEQFARQINQRYDYTLYFKSSEVDSIRVNLSIADSNLSEVLDIVFTGTDLRFSIDKDKNVFITRGKPIRTLFPKTFFERVLVGGQTSAADSLHQAEDRTFAKNKLWTIGSPQQSVSPTEVLLRGKVSSEGTGNPILGAVLYASGGEARSITDEEGNYSIRLPKGRHTLIVQNFGAYQEQRQVNLLGDGTLDVYMDDNIISLMEVTVTSEKSANIERPEMGLQSITVKSMRKIPAVLGEVDVLKSILTLPGVKTVGEASVGFNVRGGAADQNLVLFNNATIYNPAHLFGLFSAFNSDMIERVDLYKAGIPVEFGGRLSSVLDVKAKYGNKEKIEGGGGVGPMTSRLYLEGPLGAKTTFALSGRTTYSNWLFGLLDEESEFRNSRASFYDVNLNAEHTFDAKNKVQLSVYGSRDFFRFDQDTSFSYQNQNANLKWTHYFNDQFEGELTLGHDYYGFNIDGDLDPLNAFSFGFSMNQSHLRNHYRYTLNEKHKLSFGMNHIRYTLAAGTMQAKGDASLVLAERVQPEQSLESAFYLGDEYEINSRWLVNYGIRYVVYNYLGPQTITEYVPGEIKSASTVTGTTDFGSGDIIHTYHGPEIRVSARYSIDNFTSLKAGINTGRQHLNMLTNTAAISPTDTWKLSDPHIAPQLGEQFSLGYFKNLKNNTVETSVEVYYRRLRNLVDFGSGAQLLLNQAIEQDILATEGKTYGIELMAKKTIGKLNGWVSYTYSRSLLRTAEDELGEKINGGSFYPSNFDQPHAVIVAANFEFTKRINTSLNTNYSTGRPITLPIAKFQYGGSDRVFYSDRNAHRIPDYFRVDFSVNIEGNHRIRKLAHASWSLGVYNVLGRSNPYSVYFAPVQGVLEGFQLSIFARPIPFITYNFKF
nr:TonB-dependent receptor plug domain-containing protein [Cytophagales bacterium]